MGIPSASEVGGWLGSIAEEVGVSQTAVEALAETITSSSPPPPDALSTLTSLTRASSAVHTSLLTLLTQLVFGWLDAYPDDPALAAPANAVLDVLRFHIPTQPGVPSHAAQVADVAAARAAAEKDDLLRSQGGETSAVLRSLVEEQRGVIEGLEAHVHALRNQSLSLDSAASGGPHTAGLVLEDMVYENDQLRRHLLRVRDLWLQDIEAAAARGVVLSDPASVLGMGQIGTLETSAGGGGDRVQALEAEVIELRAELAQIEVADAGRDALQGKLSQAELEAKMLRSQISDLQLSSTAHDLDALKAENAALEAHLQEMRLQLQQARRAPHDGGESQPMTLVDLEGDRVADLETRLASLAEERKGLKAEVRDLKMALADAPDVEEMEQLRAALQKSRASAVRQSGGDEGEDRRRVVELEGEVSALEARLEGVVGERKGLKSQVHDLRMALADAPRDEEVEELRAALQKSKSDVASLRASVNSDSNLDRTRTHDQDRMAELEEENRALQAKLEGMVGERKAMKSQVHDLKMTLADAPTPEEMEDLRVALQESKSKLRSMAGADDAPAAPPVAVRDGGELERRVVELEEENRALQAKLEGMVGERKAMKSQVHDLKMVLADAPTPEEMDELRAALQESKSKLRTMAGADDAPVVVRDGGELEGRMAELEEENRALQAKLEDMIAQRKTLKSQVHDLKMSLADAPTPEEVDTLRSKLQQAQSSPRPPSPSPSPTPTSALESLERRVVELEEENHALQAKLEDMVGERKTLKSQVHELKMALAEAPAVEDAEELRTTLQLAKSDAVNAKDRVAQLEAELEQNRLQDMDAAAQIAALKSQLALAKKEGPASLAVSQEPALSQVSPGADPLSVAKMEAALRVKDQEIETLKKQHAAEQNELMKAVAKLKTVAVTRRQAWTKLQASQQAQARAVCDKASSVVADAHRETSLIRSAFSERTAILNSISPPLPTLIAKLESLPKTR